LRAYREYIAALVTYVLVFAGVYSLTGSIVPALLLGLVFGAAIGLAAYGLFPSDPELAKYQLDARRRVRTVLKTIDQIKDLAKRVQDPACQMALQKGCHVIPDLLELTQRKDSGNVAATAAKVSVYVTSVKSALEVHLQIEANPEYWSDAAQLMANDRAGFQDFEKFAIQTVQQLNQGDEAAHRAALRTLKPMTIPELST
jgi:hypothetical protein